MMSWPSSMHCMVAKGHDGDNLRWILDIRKTNDNEHMMMLLEANITSVEGFSGRLSISQWCWEGTGRDGRRLWWSKLYFILLAPPGPGSKFNPHGLGGIGPDGI